ncbi:Zinc finger protein like [Actinidia chinensis var. chinensis]|uniref:Zinc finger protein like n=1 Tax=Actinidia chinensis var. chinensis TaxID=1590841 RepID=A0A2R6P935_ACTCC|nr:Zinc finger protein like [Actinidia chinensis var. chinensis]
MGKSLCHKDPPRKSRPKTRKPKFISLRQQLSPKKNKRSGHMTISPPSAAHHHRHQEQLNLFTLHPENLVDTHEDIVVRFFEAADGGATTLTALLGGGFSSEENAPSSSLTYAYDAEDSGEGDALVRTALRSKERDASDEKWVCYSEVVEEVTSCAVDLRDTLRTRGLSLKLDYQEVMNAWSDKGPLYIHVESPQTVPDFHDPSNGLQDGWGSNGGLWTVPENIITSGNIKVKEEEILLPNGGEEWKVGAREASVLRYKEKRQSRLFSKRIRYEVRKINAEKRPRMKGRFVKRN